MPPVLPPNALEAISHSAEQTRRIGFRLGALLHPGDLVCLHGDLGCGKTTFVQGVARGWGSFDQANSPTFVLINVYRRTDGNSFYHMDAYRLSGAAEAWDLDLEAYLQSGPLLVEWAERIQSALPEARLDVTFSWVDEEQRDLIFTANGAHYEALLNEFRRRTFGR
ncbi:MAG: tRNA (adenosine(37)-N6)-threonylcarbamoyltransferase complex ATPase subunit type 1 TsaE [Anaerolineales bacterium]